MTQPEVYDTIVIGAGVAGLNAARLLAQQNISYKILEADNYIGGRLKTEQIPVPNATTNSYNNGYVPFEHGGAWLHGIEDSFTVNLYKELYAKHRKEDFMEFINPIIGGCGWLLPEYIEYDAMALVDPVSQSMVGKKVFNIAMVIVIYHLRFLLRLHPDMPLSAFVQPYVNWVVAQLKQNYMAGNNNDNNTTLLLTIEEIECIGRIVGSYWSWVESYNGVPIGVMVSGDVMQAFDDSNEIPTQLQQLALETNNNENTTFDITRYNTLSQLSYNIPVQSILPQYQNRKTPPTIEEILKDENKAVAAFFNITITQILPAVLSTNNDNNDIANVTMDYKTMIYHYQNAVPYFFTQDALIHGNYKGHHCTLKRGYGELIELLALDTESYTGKSLNIALNERVVAIDAPNVDDNENTHENKKTKITTYNTQTGVYTDYYATRGVISTMSLNAFKNSITFEQKQTATSHDENNNTIVPAEQQENTSNNNNIKQQTLQDIVKSLYDGTEFVYYKKVAILFSETWWKDENYRFISILQQDSDMLQYKCPHGHGNGNNIEDKQQQQLYYIDENGNNCCDFSEPAYQCIVNTAKQTIENEKQNKNKNNDNDTTNTDNNNNLLNYIPCCSINLTMESHLPFKHYPFLSCSLVGSFAEQHLLHLPQDVVIEIVLNQYRGMYNTLWRDVELEKRPEFKVLITRVTNWGENQHFGQSYSLISNTTQYDTTQRITAAAQYGVFFAGESFDNLSTGGVQAALESAATAVKHLILGTRRIQTDDDSSQQDDDSDNKEEEQQQQ